jgi:peptidylprolyl isomerase
MRRAAAFVIAPLLAATAVAGCGSSSSSKPAAADPSSITVSGTFGKSLSVTIPKSNANGALYTKTVIKGTGEKLTSAEGLVGRYVVYDWSGTTNKQLDSSYKDGKPSIFVGSYLPALKNALVGQPIGSRVLVVVPPKDGLGSNAAQAGVGANDTLVFAVDMSTMFDTASVPGAQTSNAGGTLPTVTAPAAGSKAGPTVTVNTKAAPPKTLQVKTLLKGTGAVVKKGDTLAFQYTGLIWNTGKVFQSSWTAQGVSTSQVGQGQLIPGWDKGLVGQTVGSRVLLVLPPAEGYGSAGKPPTIKGTDTLVFVVDILAAD